MSNTFVLTSSVGLEGKDVYIAHEKGNRGPELKDSDYRRNNLRPSADKLYLFCCGIFLKEDEEFRLLVHVKDEDEARRIYDKRITEGVHVGSMFVFDAKQNTFWFLAESHPVVRRGEWNQSNTYP